MLVVKFAVSVSYLMSKIQNKKLLTKKKNEMFTWN